MQRDPFNTWFGRVFAVLIMSMILLALALGLAWLWQQVT